jgi:hypothetical protein
MNSSFKTPIYIRRAQKTYRDKNRDIINQKAREKYNKNKDSKEADQDTKQQDQPKIYTIDDLINETINKN